MPLANAQIVGARRTAAGEPLQSLYVGVCQIGYVDKVAHAGPVGGVIVGAQNSHVGAAPAGGIQNERNKVSLRVVAFADLVVGIGASSVEIAQCDGAKRVGIAEIG